MMWPSRLSGRLSMVHGSAMAAAAAGAEGWRPPGWSAALIAARSGELQDCDSGPQSARRAPVQDIGGKGLKNALRRSKPSVWSSRKACNRRRGSDGGTAALPTLWAAARLWSSAIKDGTLHSRQSLLMQCMSKLHEGSAQMKKAVGHRLPAHWWSRAELIVDASHA